MQRIVRSMPLEDLCGAILRRAAYSGCRVVVEDIPNPLGGGRAARVGNGSFCAYQVLAVGSDGPTYSVLAVAGHGTPDEEVVPLGVHEGASTVAEVIVSVILGAIPPSGLQGRPGGHPLSQDKLQKIRSSYPM